MAKTSSKKLAAVISRQRWTAEDAKFVLEAASRSGMPLNAFAAQHEMAPCRLYRWSCRLHGRAAAEEPVSFEEIPVGRGIDGLCRQDDRIEVELPSGHLVRVGARFDDMALGRLLVVLDEAERRC